MLTLFASPEDQEPANPYDGQVWLKLSITGPVLMRYKESGSCWEAIGGVTNANLLDLIKSRDGSGSGLDADLLDGREAAQFLQCGTNGVCMDISNQDLNNISAAGLYRGVNMVNGPDSSWFYFLVFKHDNSFLMQIALTLFLTNGFWVRVKNNNTWGSWKKIWYESNQGSGSGLNADKLDGLQATDFHQKASRIALNGKFISYNDGSNSGITFDENNTMSSLNRVCFEAPLSLGAYMTLTVSNGEITVTKSYHHIDTEGGASTDYLDNINGGMNGDMLLLAGLSIGHKVIHRTTVGNLRLKGNCTLTQTTDFILLINGGGQYWLEISRSIDV